MGVLVWGFGNYFKHKQAGISRDSIMAFVSAKETGTFQGIDIIKPRAISQYSYSKLYIMVGVKAFFEILEELNTIGYMEWDKVVVGWNIAPYAESEIMLAAEGKFQCDSDGICRFYSTDGGLEVRNVEDWTRLLQTVTRKRKKNELLNLPLSPLSSIFGLDRGQPIDRYYMEKFLEENSCLIQGTVLEVADRGYTIKFGRNVTESIITRLNKPCGSGERIVNLETGEGVQEELADCFILTQTLPFIFDVRLAAENVIRLLKKGGTALVTVSGISQISRYDMDRWGHYWSFTTASLQRLFEACRDVQSVEVKAYGNVKSAASGLYGLAVEDMELEDLMHQDDDYQQLITAVVKKKVGEENVYKF